jgi:peptidoglycan/xylan/chitin deacetylase (PgdA/CDA1 family)
MLVTRADRALTLYLFHPLRQAMPGKQSARIPILMYHSISAERRDGHPYFEISTSPSVFAEHMEFLRREGYSSLSLKEAAQQIESKAPPNEKQVVITFDDGYRDFLTGAFPVLRRCGFSATMFLPTRFIGEQVQRFNDTDCLTWSEVRDLQQAGMEFGSHTVSHPQLRSLSFQEIERELRSSKEEMEQKTGTAVRCFSYPYAFPESDRHFVHTLRGLLEAAGYIEGVSTIVGTAQKRSDRFFLERLPVNSWDDLHFFKAKLEGGYDWLHSLQYARKVFKRKAQ